MAKKILVDNILKLYSKLGGNVADVLGSRTNINFLGKGKNTEAFLDSDINIEAIGILGKNKVLDELKSSMGFLTADKLNDIQAGQLYTNLLKIDEVFNPKQIPNIIDMGTGTRNLTQEGLGSLRTPKEGFSMEIAEGPQKGKNISLDEFYEMTGAKGVPPEGGEAGSLMGRITDRMKNIQSASDELSNIKPMSVEDVFGVGKRGTNEIDALETMTRNKAGTEFVTAYVDDIYKNAGVTSSVDVPKKRAAAREFLYNMLKKETDLLPPGKGGTLESVVSETDYKYIMEGGGGALGDPLVLVKKYFGDTIARRVPLDSRVEIIDTFVDNVRFAKDRAGFRTDDPRFNPDDIPEFADGGRAGFKFGGSFTKAQVLIARLKNTLKGTSGKTDETSVYVNETFPNFIKEIKANPKLAENENVWKALGGELPKDQRLVVHGDDTVDFFTQTKFGPHNIENITRFIEQYPFLSRKEAMRILRMEPEDRVLEITRLEILNRRTKNAHGGLAKILEV